MRTIDDIAADGARAMRSLLLEAFNAGREAGQRDASENLKAKLATLLSTETAADNFERHSQQVAADVAVRSVEVEERALPGTVKPTVLQLIADSREGATTAEVVRRTGFKPNSVRGTLWTLNTEDVVARYKGRWYSRAMADEIKAREAEGSASVAQMHEAPADHSAEALE